MLINYTARLTDDRWIAEDIAQEVLLAFWQHGGQFQGRSTLGWYLKRSAQYTAYDWLKRRRKRECVSLDDDDAGDRYELIEDSDAAFELNQVETRMILQPLLERLPSKMREALVMRIDGLSYAEIALQVGCPVGTIRSRLSWAHQELNRATTSEAPMRRARLRSAD